MVRSVSAHANEPASHQTVGCSGNLAVSALRAHAGLPVSLAAALLLSTAACAYATNTGGEAFVFILGFLVAVSLLGSILVEALAYGLFLEIGWLWAFATSLIANLVSNGIAMSLLVQAAKASNDLGNVGVAWVYLGFPATVAMDAGIVVSMNRGLPDRTDVWIVALVANLLTVGVLTGIIVWFGF